MNGIDYFQMTPGMSMVRVTEKQRIDILMLISKILFELSIEIKNFGVEIVLRKLLLSLMSVQLAQNIGIDPTTHGCRSFRAIGDPTYNLVRDYKPSLFLLVKFLE